MTEYNFPWSGVTTGKAGPYTADLFAQYSQHLMNNALRDNAGVVIGSGDGVNAALAIQETAIASTSVRVRTGAAFVAGRLYITDADVILPVTANSSGNPRIDLMVLRSNSATQIITPFIIEGTPAGSPVAPSPVQSGSIYDIPLAEIAVSSPFASIVNANIDNTVRDYHILLPVELGGTGVRSVVEGDVLIATAANTLEAFLIPDDEVLVRNDSDPNSFRTHPLQWELIAEGELVGSTTTISISSIPAKYEDLVLVIKARSTGAVATLNITFNSDTGANYSNTRIQQDNVGTITAAASNNQTSVSLSLVVTPSTGGTAGFFGYLCFRIGAYANPDITRLGEWEGAMFTTVTNLQRNNGVFGWENLAAAISSIQLNLSVGDFTAGTVYALYGVGRAQ